MSKVKFEMSQEQLRVDFWPLIHEICFSLQVGEARKVCISNYLQPIHCQFNGVSTEDKSRETFLVEGQVKEPGHSLHNKFFSGFIRVEEGKASGWVTFKD